MDLNSLRAEIDNIDNCLLKLFIQRMDISRKVAIYKKENNLPVLQGNREEEILTRIAKDSPPTIAGGSSLLFKNIMNISKELQYAENSKPFKITSTKFNPFNAKIVGCQGLAGSYGESAARKLFPNANLEHYETFENVFKAVMNEEIQYGILPIENSTRGSVSETYDLMRKYNFYISARIQIPIAHCLAANDDHSLENITEVYSHEQALGQCSKFLSNNNLNKKAILNTAVGAKMVSESTKPIAAICSVDCAKLYNLKILEENIADVSPNFTRFICISKDAHISKDSNIISVALSIPNEEGSLYNLLTKFSINQLNLCHIESKPQADGSFNVIFYLDFTGNINDHHVAALLEELSASLNYFKFLGNYGEII